MKFEIANTNKNKLYESKHKVFKPSKRKATVSEDLKKRMRMYEAKHKLANTGFKKGEIHSHIDETYWIDNKEVMNQVSKLGKELEDDGFKFYNDKYSGSTYYDFYTKRGDNGAICKAVQYSHDGAQIIDVTIDQLIGNEPIDSFETMRRKLGKMLLPQREAIERIDSAEKKKLLSLLDDLAFYLEKDNYALVDTTLNKMINVRKGLVEDVEVKVDSVNSTEKVPEAPKTPEDTGIATILNNLIIDEWEAINGYNSAIATLVDIGKTDGIDVLKDIVNEENVHVGQLQKVLEIVAPNVTSIGEGEAEAEEQLEDKGEFNNE